MLDLDHGTYPVVTSSPPTAGYAAAAGGFAPQHIDRVVGITKAYVTRVGAGPFPTEALDDDGERMGERGHEFGTTTGRKRRCGWFDAPVLRSAARLNGLSELVLTKLDVLSGFERVKVCVAYRVDGDVFDDVPPTQTAFHHAEPVWEELPGWDGDLGEARTPDARDADAAALLDEPDVALRLLREVAARSSRAAAARPAGGRLPARLRVAPPRPRRAALPR